MSFLIVLIYGLILFFDFKFSDKKFTSNRGMFLYRILVLLTFLISFPTALALELDHIGASLSGLVTLFGN